MQVVLIKDHNPLGKRGEVKTVKNGYFMNFLFPQRIAVAANKGNLEMAEVLEKKRIIEKEKLIEQAKEVLKKLEGLTIEIKAKVSKEDKLYGAIKEQDVLDQIEAKAKIKLTKKNLVKFKPIKQLGEIKVKIKINEEVSTDITLNIVKE